jgi:hypothetical protein
MRELNNTVSADKSFETAEMNGAISLPRHEEVQELAPVIEEQALDHERPAMQMSAESSTTYHEAPSTDSAVVVRTWADRLGICLSGLCVVHCAMMPILVLAIPTLEMGFLHEFFHESLLVVLPVLAVAAFVPGYRKHRDARVFLWSLPGLVLIALGALVFGHESLIAQGALTIAGSVLLIRAHQVNRKLCACCESGHSHAHGGMQKRKARLLSTPPR